MPSIRGSDGLSFSYDDRAERITGEAVSPNFFTALGVAPILGQGFTPETRAGRWAPEVVLSYRFWKRRFAGDPGVIGRIIQLNTHPFTIVGVSSPAFFDLNRGFEPELRLPVLPLGRRLSQIELIGGSPGYGVATMAHLLQYDSLLGRFPGDVSVEGGSLEAAGKQLEGLA